MIALGELKLLGEVLKLGREFACLDLQLLYGCGFG